MFKEAVENEERNRLILEDVKKVYAEGHKILLLTERTNHACYLYGSLRKEIDDVILLYGGQKKEERKNQETVLGGLGDKPFVVVSIGKYIGEGFDDSRFDTLFISYPFRWKGILAQYCGRLQRKEGALKRVDVYDYVDPMVPAFSRMYGSREKGYFDLGYKIENLDPIYGSQILSYREYEGKLLDDLETAKSEVSLFMDYFQENRVKWLLRKMSCPFSVILSGGSPLEDVPNIVRLGKPLPNMVIIDMRIIYYGGLNPFMFGQKDGTILRIVDPSMAAELKEELLS